MDSRLRGNDRCDGRLSILGRLGGLSSLYIVCRISYVVMEPPEADKYLLDVRKWLNGSLIVHENHHFLLFGLLQKKKRLYNWANVRV